MTALAPRFLCDEMLARLGRYLRAAGYDTVLACDGAPDAHWIALASREERVLLTCDRQLLSHRAATGVALWLAQGALDEQARAVREQCGVDWMWRPFSRCLMDNQTLCPASQGSLERLPARVRGRDARECPECERIYWAGSHHRRMRIRLAGWNAVAKVNVLQRAG